jgi:hypothetical protein
MFLYRLPIVFSVASICFAQTVVPPKPPAQPRMVRLVPETEQLVEGGTLLGAFTFDAKAVQGRPYTAEAVTQTTQVLANGLSASREVSGSVARDKEGRVRRELSWDDAAPGEKIILLNDSSGSISIYEPDDAAHQAEATALPSSLQNEYLYRVLTSSPYDSQPKRENLWTESFDGISADGTRTTKTINPTEPENSSPVEIASESWYSRELQTLVMLESNDSRIGKPSFRLTDVKPGKPKVSLVGVPEGYKLKTTLQLQKEEGSNELRYLVIYIVKKG